MVNKGSSFADRVRFRSHTYARTQQSLPPLRPAINLIRSNMNNGQILNKVEHLKGDNRKLNF